MIHHQISTIHGKRQSNRLGTVYNTHKSVLGGAPMDEDVRKDDETRQDEWFDVMREWFGE